MNRTYLDVPVVNSDEASLLGAKWDEATKKWYCCNASKNRKVLLEKWKLPPIKSVAKPPKVVPSSPPPIDLIGEDRSFSGNALFIDMVPSTSWGTNVRSMVARKDWDRVRRHVYERVNYTCECCGINTKEDTKNGRIEAHERWSYDDETRVQKLMRIVALCRQCHFSTHMGFAGVLGLAEEARRHLKTVRNFTDEQLKSHNAEAGALWRKRSQIEWKLDISLIVNNGIQTITPDVTCNTMTIRNHIRMECISPPQVSDAVV